MATKIKRPRKRNGEHVLTIDGEPIDNFYALARRLGVSRQLISDYYRKGLVDRIEKLYRDRNGAASRP